MVVCDLDDLKEVVKSCVSEVIESMTHKEEKYVTLKEARAILGVSKSTLDRWDDAGVLDKCKIGSKVRYRMSDIERKLNGNIPK